METSKNIRHLKRLLQRRIAGETGADEERRLSKQAADDPFLQDALEGLDAFPEGDHAARLERLQGRLQARSRRRRIVPLFIQRAAAAVVVLGLFGLGWWLLSDGKGEMPGPDAPQAIVTPPAAPSEPGPLADHTLPATGEKTSPPAPPPSRRETLPNTSGPPVSPQPEDIAAVEKPATVMPADTQGHAAVAEWAEAAPAPEPKKESIASPKTADADIAKTQPARAATQAAPPATPAPSGFRVITGKISDGDTGEPLIGASVLLQGTPQGTVTDFDGSFRLQIPEKEADARLVISYTGYENKVVEVGDRQKLNVQLGESMAALSEVVVVGGGRKLRKADRSASVRSFSMDVQPKGGWDALEQHISTNRRMPVQAIANGISGEVLVEFSVTTKGKLRSFKVVEPLGFGCDEEAVRLLQTGPAWQNATGKEQRTSYSVRF